MKLGGSLVLKNKYFSSGSVLTGSSSRVRLKGSRMKVLNQNLVKFPEEFDQECYRSGNPELLNVSQDMLREHFVTYGVPEGRPGNNIKERKDFVALLPKNAKFWR
jgi:hypothetical protein